MALVGAGDRSPEPDVLRLEGGEGLDDVDILHEVVVVEPYVIEAERLGALAQTDQILDGLVRPDTDAEAHRTISARVGRDILRPPDGNVIFNRRTESADRTADCPFAYLP